jgi:hypothetical protein
MPSKFLTIQPDSLAVATAAYTANDVVGGLLTFSIDQSFDIDGALLQYVMLNDAANQSEAFSLWLFNDTPTTIADADAFAPTIGDLNKRIGNPISISTSTSVNSLSYGTSSNLTRTLQFSKGKLYAYLVCTDTPDYAATTDLTLFLSLISQGR